MSRQDAFRLIETIGFCTLAGTAVPEVRVDGDYAAPADVADALAAFGRKVARYLEALPDSVSDQIEMREAVRAGLDRVLSDCALVIERTIREIDAAG